MDEKIKKIKGSMDRKMTSLLKEDKKHDRKLEKCEKMHKKKKR